MIEIPLGCPHCNATEFRILTTVRQKPLSGVIEGVAYNHITWRRCRCEKCQGVYMKRSYRLK